MCQGKRNHPQFQIQNFHEKIPPKQEIQQEETDHDHSPNIGQEFFPPRTLIGGYQMNPKLELPKFNEKTKKSVPWVNKADFFFSIDNIISNGKMIKYASMQLEDRSYN